MWWVRVSDKAKKSMLNWLVERLTTKGATAEKVRRGDVCDRNEHKVPMIVAQTDVKQSRSYIL